MVATPRAEFHQFQASLIVAPVLLGRVVVLPALSAGKRDNCPDRSFRHSLTLCSFASHRAHDGDRTHGHTLTKGVLYLLSYVGQQRAAEQLPVQRKVIVPHFHEVSNGGLRCSGRILAALVLFRSFWYTPRVPQCPVALRR